mgnify:CR=1 FL=1
MLLNVHLLRLHDLDTTGNIYSTAFNGIQSFS